MMASEKEIFSLTGPTFLTSIDWNNSHHRRSVAASLVQGVYTMERDRQQNRPDHQALAPPWWQFFNFKLNQILVDNHDLSYFGAIYEFNSLYPYHSYSGQRPPQYVIAFRAPSRSLATGSRTSSSISISCSIISTTAPVIK
ncbi:UNVERIFIED_CONTAM: GDSL esterase/lipase [Sesamum radiatum]|uniref:GDSL esterase/lipase n=1 Tax=Sesamum radiatum TaxID=300843 RepID=A0AAW2NDB7_SESRA